MKFHEELNPKIWTKMREKRIGGKTNYYLKPEVKDKLDEIAEAFIDYLDIPEEAILDIRITGSSANYNYTPHSDLDLHVIVDYDKIHEDCPIVEGYLWSMKSAFNKDHDISIYGIPVELYAEDSRVEAISNGVYSLLNNKWLKIPEKIKPTSNDAAVEAKFNELAEAIHKCDDSEVAKELQDKIYQMRKTGLSQEGEFSTENLAFKKLRDIGALDKLRQLKKAKIDKELTLESLLIYESAALKYDKYPSFKDFFINVVNDINNNKNLKHKIHNYKLSLPADVIIHDFKKHNINFHDWIEVFKNIDNIFITNKSNYSSPYSNINYLIGIRTSKGNYYALCIAVTNNDNFIATCFKDTKKAIISYVMQRNKEKKKPELMFDQPTVKLPSENSDSVANQIQVPNNIIQQNIENFKTLLSENLNIRELNLKVEKLLENFN